MRNDTRLAFTAYTTQIASLNGVGDVTKAFNVSPTAQQTLETRLQESSEFLSRINVIGVDEQIGQALGLTATSTIASRTATEAPANGERQTQDPTGLAACDYLCKQTDYDTHVTYAKLDAWAKFKDFQTRLRDVILKQCALDRIMIGWNGTSAAATTNRAASPLLQDVNIGWLEKIRTLAAERVMKEGDVAGKLTYGSAGADYKNLDALVYDLAKQLLDPWHQEYPELVAIVGRDLMHDKLFPLVAENDAPTERLAADIVISQRRLGGLPAVTVPFFPAGKVLVTRLDNLSIYYQRQARRRYMLENPRKNRVENYESSNDAYVIEDFGLCALAENIEHKA